VSQPRQIHNLALIGFMGTGKSSVGRMVAAQLRFDFVDTDQLIENRTGKRISDIFAQAGETGFREIEKQVVADLANLRHTVIATGGGLGADPENLASLKQHAVVVCLWASSDVIWQRVRGQAHRPLLQDANPMAKIQDLLAVRGPIYRQADVLIGTGMRSIKEVAFQVRHSFEEIRRGAKS
jgi:shikimate kinase